ncbi:MAG: hypothetical protein PHQ81_01925 [Methanofollis sp.]|nr:hypothetical protein [Methanofollis sp.]
MTRRREGRRLVTQRCGQYESDEGTETWVVVAFLLQGAPQGFCYYSDWRRTPSTFVVKSEED